MRVFSRKRLAVLAVLAVATGAVVPSAGREGAVVADSTPQHVIVQHGAVQRLDAATTSAVQARLKSYGYAIAVDGIYGPQTTKAVTHWQRANGLIVDGIVGPQTLRSLGLTGGAGTATSGTPAPTPSVAVYQHPEPDVERWHSAAVAAGWSEVDWKTLSCIIWGESRGRPTAHGIGTYDDSYGLLQLNTKGYLWDWYASTGLTYKGQLLDAATNLSTAKRLSNYTASARWSGYDRWRPWRSTSRSRVACFS